MNSQNLPMEGGSLECISATQFKLAINTTLDAPLPARLSEFSVDLYNKETTPFSPFTNLTIFGQKINGNTKLIIPSQLVTIKNEAELDRWFDQVFDSETVDLSITGRPTVHLGELSSTPNLDKTTSMPGLNRLSGFGIIDLKVVFPPDSNGNNIKGTINIPNAGALTLNFGNITFDIYSGSTKLGYMTTYEVLLNRGNNTLNWDGSLDLPTVAKNIGPILASQKDALKRGQVEFNVIGTKVMVNGERIPYIEQVIGRKPLISAMPVIALVSDVLGGFLGAGGGASIADAVGDVVGNNTFLQNVMNNFNKTQTAKKSTKLTSLTKRAPNPKDALMWNMLKLGLRMKLNQASI
ncbi:hypothetical protein E4U25_005696 [Claviceps purpurea]|nr:hypothetical protein E4U25_005696 [Claviceps purpurea]